MESEELRTTIVSFSLLLIQTFSYTYLSYYIRNKVVVNHKSKTIEQWSIKKSSDFIV